MLVGNKCDLNEMRWVSTDEGLAFAQREGLLFIETSALDATNVREAFTRLVAQIVLPPSQKPGQSGALPVISDYRPPQVEPDFLVKLVLIGGPGVGKTNLLGRFDRDEFKPDSRPTIGISFATVTLPVDGRTGKAQIWDVAGRERHRPPGAAVFRGAGGILLVYDVAVPASFEALPLNLEAIRENTESGVVIMLVGNKCDAQGGRVVSTEQGADFAKREGILFMETSALDATNVREAFTAVITEVVRRLPMQDDDE
jgi:Ras-related protein Rab-11A